MRRILSATLLTSFLALLCSVASAQLPTQPIHIKLGYSNTSGFTGMWVARAEGIFARHGLEVEPVQIALNSTIPAALLGGSVQVAGPTPPVLLQAVEGGIDLVIIAGCSANDTSKAGQGVVARTGVNIAAAKDFEGKRVGVPGIGSYMQVLFRRWLVQKGADERKVQYVEVPFAQGNDILKAGNVDAILISDPYLSRVLANKSGYLVSAYLREMPDGLFSIYYAASRDWAAKNPAVVRAFRESIDEANAFLLREPVKSREILGAGMKLPAEAMKDVWIPRLTTAVPESDVRYWIDTLVSQGIIRTHLDAAKLLVN